MRSPSDPLPKCRYTESRHTSKGYTDDHHVIQMKIIQNFLLTLCFRLHHQQENIFIRHLMSHHFPTVKNGSVMIVEHFRRFTY